MRFIRFFNQLSMADIYLVGGKNAALGQLVSLLSKEGVRVPNGFALTVQAYWYYLEYNKLIDVLRQSLRKITDSTNIAKLQEIGFFIRERILAGVMPDDVIQEICIAYQVLSQEYGVKEIDVAVRSSATSEDLPNASFAGQQETFLNVRGESNVVEACKKSFASLFTDRAIIYRFEKGFDHLQVALSVGVQKMVRSDRASAGVAFSVDTESGFKDVVMIESSWGLGESIVKGLVIPDEFIVFTPKLQNDLVPIIKKALGIKNTKIVCTQNQILPTKQVATKIQERTKFSLNNQEILELGKTVAFLDAYYTQKYGKWTPVDVEWAKDGIDEKIYIVQVRPETVHSQRHDLHVLCEYRLLANVHPIILTKGMSIGRKIVSGPARVIASVKEIGLVKTGDIIVTTMSDPDWVPAMKKAAGIVTQEGGRTCHAAIVSRELDIPALVGAIDCMSMIQTGDEITLDCSQGTGGFVYKGVHLFEVITTELTQLPQLPIELTVNLGNPDSAFNVSQLPVDGVGLARIEFIISNTIKIHPMALLHPERIKDAAIRKTIEQMISAYETAPAYFIDTLAYGIGTIAAAFYPRHVIVRLSDFKTNEYANLIGGHYFEPVEENPMLGFRGASRYCDDRYKEAFALECAALTKVRNQMGLENVWVMVPFVRTTEEAEQVLNALRKNGLTAGKKGLNIIMMAETPANVLLVDDFSKYVDGFSIGSNDLTQLVLGIDRDSALLEGLFDERNPAVKKMFKLLIEGANYHGKYSSICGQAPSDFPELAHFLVDCGIDAISLNPDAVIPFMLHWNE